MRKKTLFFKKSFLYLNQLSNDYVYLPIARILHWLLFCITLLIFSLRKCVPNSTKKSNVSKNQHNKVIESQLALDSCVFEFCLNGLTD